MDAFNQVSARPPIVIVPYRPSWADEFAALARGLRDALGPLALRIDHIGSTSVPGLAAKDIIDIQVTVQALDEPVGRALESAGYRRREPISADHVPPGQPETPCEWAKWLYRPAGGQRSTNVHTRVAGRLNQRYPLLFRDYLRAHPNATESYALVKMALAKYHAGDVEAYYDVKDPVCDIIMAAAEEWATATHWQPQAAGT
jgi:GrpB-like predicted nucleotidyltransferase (UPF0157 family)